MKRVLIVHGSKMGATAGIADLMAVAFADRGIEADVRPADLAPSPEPFDAVVVGGALYAGHWMAASRRWVQEHTAALRARPVWLFSSGPLDERAEHEPVPPVHEVEQLSWSIGARGHETFGGRLDREHAKGLVARLMARKMSGDWRDEPHIVAWTDEIADSLLADSLPAEKRRAEQAQAEQSTAGRRGHPSFVPPGRASPAG
jgi:menaquinone-dependent protoporphyrinogen oxidase